MTLEVVLGGLGALLLVAGLLGGGVKVSQIEIPQVGRIARACAFVLGLVFLGAAIAIGTSDGQEEATDQEERVRLLEELARDRRELGDRRESGKDSGQQLAPPPASADCGGGLTVGPNTSCSFAENVRDAYRESGGGSSIRAYSPVTKQTYTLSCTAGSTTVCMGGNNARVHFR